MSALTGKKLWAEFRNFAFKGNVVDLAVGVIIGSAFAKIVDAMVKNILMPLISLVTPGEQSYLAWTVEIGGASVKYGQFLGELLNFLIVALALWLFFSKFLGALRARHQEEEAAKPPPPPPKEEVLLLREIRDLLAKESG